MNGPASVLDCHIETHRIAGSGGARVSGVLASRRWGEILLHPLTQGMADYPEILEIRR
jgi:hypothetical protein